MPSPRTAGRPRQASDGAGALSEAAIVEAALSLLAESGVARLTMRELSARLGVALGATYRHVRSKHDLLHLVVETLYDRIEPGDPRADGYAQAKQVMVQIHDVLGAYPGLAGHVGQHMGEFVSVRVAKLVSEPLIREGLSSEEAGEVRLALTLLTAGHVQIRDSLPALDGEPGRQAFEGSVDLVLDGARARVGRRAPRKRLRR